MTTDQVEGALKAVEDALYDVEQENDYIVRLNDFDDAFELDTKDGHRIIIEVSHKQLTADDIEIYEGKSQELDDYRTYCEGKKDINEEPMSLGQWKPTQKEAQKEFDR